MSSFSATDGDEDDVEIGKERLAEHLEAAVRSKAEENLALYQELLRKQALLEEAEAVFDEANELIEQRNLSLMSSEPDTTDTPTTTTGVKDEAGKAETVELPSECIGEKLAPYNPTNTDACNIALDMLDLKEGDVLYDLGCGDARLLVEAWNRMKESTGKNPDDIDFRAIGIEYDSALFKRGQDQVIANGLIPEQATVIHDNVMNADYSDATALFIYLVPAGMKAVKDTLLSLMKDREGLRVVTYVFSVPGMEPKEVNLYKQSTKLYLYDHTCL